MTLRNTWDYFTSATGFSRFGRRELLCTEDRMLIENISISLTGTYG